MDRIAAVLMSDWFHGDIDEGTAAKLLRADSRIGTFLVRFSGREPGTFTLSRIVGTPDNKEILHQRIRNQPPNGLAYSGSYFNTLPKLIDQVSKQYELRHAVTGSMYRSLNDRWTSKLQNTIDDRSCDTGFHMLDMGNYLVLDSLQHINLTTAHIIK